MAPTRFLQSQGHDSMSTIEISKTLFDINQMKKRIKLAERCHQIMTKKLQKVLEKNAKEISSLSAENFESRRQCYKESNSSLMLLKNKFPDRSKRDVLPAQNKSLPDMTSDVGYHMCKSKGQHNNLVFLKQKKLQEIKALKTAWASNMKLNLQPDEKSMERKKMIENDLNKIKQKSDLAKQINQIYKGVKDRLKDEVLFFPKALNDLQKDLDAVKKEQRELLNMRSFAVGECQNTLKKKHLVESRFRHSRTSRIDMIRKLERQVRLNLKSCEADHSTILDKKGKKNLGQQMMSKKKSSKNMITPLAITELEKKADLLNLATGVSIWDEKKMTWCLKTQLEISKTLKNESDEKFKSLKLLTKTKNDLENQLIKVQYDDDARDIEKIESMKCKISEETDAICNLKKEIYKKENMVQDIDQTFQYFIHILLQKISEFEMPLHFAMPEFTEDENQIEKNLSILLTVLPQLAIQAKDHLEKIEMTEDEVLQKPLQIPKQIVVESSHNFRLGRTNDLAVEDLDFININNNEYVSRAKLKKRFLAITRGKKKSRACLN